MTMKLSYSQINQFATCAEQFRLERIVHAPSIPSWPAIGGNAVHTITEVEDYRLLGIEPPEELRAIRTFDDALDHHVNLALLRSPDFDKSEWHVGGRPSQANPDKENEKWWRTNGPLMLNRWKSFMEVVPWDLYLDPDGMPGIEVSVEFETPDGDLIRGFIDRIFQDRATGSLIVLDLKSGQEPKSPRQLGFYRQALAHAFPEMPSVDYGTFWMSRKGQTTGLVDLRDHTAERLFFQTSALHRAVDSGIFIANPGSLCSSCSVRNVCYEMHPETTPAAYLPWANKEG